MLYVQKTVDNYKNVLLVDFLLDPPMSDVV